MTTLTPMVPTLAPPDCLTRRCIHCRMFGDLQVLITGLQDQPSIAGRVCNAVGRLAEGFKDYAGQSSPLSPFFKQIVSCLLAAAQRTDNNHVDNTRLQLSAFEAINDMVGWPAAPVQHHFSASFVPSMVQHGMPMRYCQQQVVAALLQARCGVRLCCASCHHCSSHLW